MNFQQLQNSVSYWLDDLNFGYFTQTQVKTWLNASQREVQKRLIKAGQNYYIKYVSTPLVVNQRDYVLPDDFKKLHRLEVVVTGSDPNESVTRLSEITINQQDLVTTGAATPQWYYVRRNRLVLRPAPDTILTMRMQYTYEVADMSNDTDVPDVPESYHELIALLAARDGFIKDGRASALLESKIKEFEKDLDQDAADRTQDGPRGIVETGNDASAGYYF